MSLINKLKNGKSVYTTYASKVNKGFVLEGDILINLQSCLTRMYMDIQSVCEKHNIRIYAAGGTALGAVRHQGFIPWDDDIDCAMTRSDYRKFIKVFESELSDKYILNAPNYSDNSIARFPKIQKKGTKCVSVGDNENDDNYLDMDIFIIDNIPKNWIVRITKGLVCNLKMFIANQVHMFENWQARKDIYIKAGKIYTYFRFVCGMLFSFRSYSNWMNTIDKAVQYDHCSGLIGLPTGSKHYFGEIHNIEILEPARKMPFDDGYVYVFNDIEVYLTKLYGDFMQIPSEEKRGKHYIKELIIDC